VIGVNLNCEADRDRPNSPISPNHGQADLAINNQIRVSPLQQPERPVFWQ